MGYSVRVMCDPSPAYDYFVLCPHCDHSFLTDLYGVLPGTIRPAGARPIIRDFRAAGDGDPDSPYVRPRVRLSHTPAVGGDAAPVDLVATEELDPVSAEPVHSSD